MPFFELYYPLDTPIFAYLSLILLSRHTSSSYSLQSQKSTPKKPAIQRAVLHVHFGYASPFRPLQGGLSTSHDACWSQTRQGDDLSPRGFVCPVFCVHLLRSFCEPCGSGRFLRGCDEAVCLQARCVFQALLL